MFLICSICFWFAILVLGTTILELWSVTDFIELLKESIFAGVVTFVGVKIINMIVGYLINFYN